MKNEYKPSTKIEEIDRLTNQTTIRPYEKPRETTKKEPKHFLDMSSSTSR